MSDVVSTSPGDSFCRLGTRYPAISDQMPRFQRDALRAHVLCGRCIEWRNTHLNRRALLQHESLEALEWLAENCVEAKGQLDPRKSVARQTALHFAAKLGKVIARTRSGRALCNSQTDERTLLQSRSLNWLAKQYLVSGHSINQKDNLGNTALHLAAQNNHLCAIKVRLPFAFLDCAC